MFGCVQASAGQEGGEEEGGEPEGRCKAKGRGVKARRARRSGYRRGNGRASRDGVSSRALGDGGGKPRGAEHLPADAPGNLRRRAGGGWCGCGREKVPTLIFVRSEARGRVMRQHTVSTIMHEHADSMKDSFCTKAPLRSSMRANQS